MVPELRRVITTICICGPLAFGQCVRGNAPSQTLSLLIPQSGAQQQTPEVTILTGSETYLSAQVGARNNAAVMWSAAVSGSYTIRLSDCTAGVLLASGEYATPDQPQTLNVAAVDFAPGATPLCVRVVAEGGSYDDAIAYIVRDDVAPTVVATPGTGPRLPFHAWTRAALAADLRRYGLDRILPWISMVLRPVRSIPDRSVRPIRPRLRTGLRSWIARETRARLQRPVIQ